MNTAVIGLNSLGLSLAQMLAVGGHNVAIFDGNPEVMGEARLKIARSLDANQTQGLITLAQSDRARNAILPAPELGVCAEADLIFESLPEHLDAKRQLLERLDTLAPRSSLLVTTTTVYSVSVLAVSAARFPERVVGMHFPAAPDKGKLVEIVRADQTSQEAVTQLLYLTHQLGRETVVVRDVPGFLIDRVHHMLSGEALVLLGEGDTDAATIDKLVESLGFEQGPFRQMDAQGLDAVLIRTRNLYESSLHEPRYRPHPLLDRLVKTGRLGRKSKHGFYKYED